MLYTENERVRKRMKTKEGFFGERAGINTEIAEVAGNTEESQGRAGPPRRAGAEGWGWWRANMPEDSIFISTG